MNIYKTKASVIKDGITTDVTMVSKAQNEDWAKFRFYACLVDNGYDTLDTEPVCELITKAGILAITNTELKYYP